MNGGQQQRPMQQPPQPHTGQRMQAVQYPEQQPTRMTQHPNQVQGHAAGPNAPPPPPPPQPHPAMMDAPPPPPQMLREPHMQHPNHPPPPPQPARPQSRGPMHDMPGTFPPDVRRPNHRPFSEEDEDPRVLRAKKTRRKGSQVPSSSSSSSSSTSSTDSDAWESDSASSSPDHVRVRNVDEGYGYVEGHKRGRSHKQKKSRKDKSHRKAKGHHQSRSRSQSRNRGKAFRKRRDSGMIESPVISRRNSFSSKDNSPRLAHAQPNIHIHIDPNKVTEERVRDHDEARERRTGHSSSPTGHRKDPRRNEKLNGGHRMSRENSVDDGSGTDSYATSSAHTGSDSIFDKPERRLSVSQRRSHQKPYSLPQGGFNNPHPSHLYDDLDDVPSARYHHADDYPYNSTTKHDSYFKQPSYNMRPDLPHRRNTTGNPFDTTFFPPKPLRTSTFAAGMHGASFPFQQKRQSSEREEQEELRREFAEYLNFKREARDSQKRYTEREDVVERDLRDFNAHEYAEFLDWKKNNYSARRAPPLKRSSTDRHDLGMYNDDDFELRYSTTRRSPYNSFDRI
ncbi:hypothetical protein T440DRAFT_467644 [Plenodomus tracheiphilus IPT5]|uniref:Uncharacterized protein n=1 Tax=Plenodomus tracheiphilus IPT5 TaxID=1408161 RepID=A0A6A7B7Y5_9PLEO|nr:hypothetical protein T440DRAFT_467644 [Plenodomus tracheiphilus IPT5]